MGSYTISLSFNSLEGFNTQLTIMNFSQLSLIIAQIQIKARDESQRSTKGYAGENLMHQERNESF